MKVVVGLGNPGSKYAGTRHNIGFEVVEYLAQSPSARPARSQFQSLVVETVEGGDKVLLVKPETYMNLSGRAVRAIVDFYKVPLEDVLIVCDDFNLPLGKLRLRPHGSHGGQNGLRNIQEQLGTDAYPRLRVGVGQPGPGEAVDFVLSRFKPGEQTVVETAIARAAQGIVVWLRDGMESSMNLTNAGEQKPKAPRRETKTETPKEPPTKNVNERL